MIQFLSVSSAESAVAISQAANPVPKRFANIEIILAINRLFCPRTKLTGLVSQYRDDNLRQDWPDSYGTRAFAMIKGAFAMIGASSLSVSEGSSLIFVSSPSVNESLPRMFGGSSRIIESAPMINGALPMIKEGSPTTFGTLPKYCAELA